MSLYNLEVPGHPGASMVMSFSAAERYDATIGQDDRQNSVADAHPQIIRYTPERASDQTLDNIAHKLGMVLKYQSE